MNDRGRILAAVGLTVLLFLGVQLGALALVQPFTEAEYQAVENPEDPTNTIVYVGVVLIATLFMLAAFRYELQWLIRGVIVLVSAMLSWYVFSVIVPPVVTIGSANVVALAAAAGVGLGLVVHPEWYVIDLAGVVMGAGAAGLFGISFGLLPAILMLVVLAVYDAISVYGTEHMLTLAEGVMDLKIPVVLVIPTRASYSYLEAGSTEGVIEDTDTDGGSGTATPVGSDGDETNGETPANTDASNVDTDVSNADTNASNADAAGSTTDADESNADPPADALERDALFVGLGDAVIPTILVASAASFLDVPAVDVPGIVLNVPALGALVGTVAGLLALMYMVLQGRPHAGLPLLNGGAIGGYLVGALASGLTVATALGL